MKAFQIAMLLWIAAIGVSASDAEQTAITYSPSEAFERLKNGNQRFSQGERKHPRGDASRRAETVSGGQHPIATIIGCSDSRSSVEVIFDQGVGDVFVVRNAGNVCSTNEIASAEYAIIHLRTPVCVVLGHTLCGAVTAATTNAKLEGHLPALIANIQPAVLKARTEHPELQGKALIPSAIETNVMLGIENLLTRSDDIRKLVADKKLLVVGGVYDLATGEVKWLGAHPSEKKLLGDAP